MDRTDVIRAHADRIAAGVFALLGVAAILIGWAGVSRTAFPAEQLPYILSAGVGGLFLLGVGATLWLSADLRDEWRKLDSIDEALRALSGTALVAPPPEEGEADGTDGPDGALQPQPVGAGRS